MIKSLFRFVLVTFIGMTFSFTESLPESPFKKIFFQDDFSGSKLKKEWGSWKSESLIRDGVMVGITPKDANHPSVNTIKYPPLSDLEVSLDFKFAGSQRFQIMFRDLSYKGSHAGHICHVGISPKSALIYDGKMGIFEKSISDNRKAGKKVDNKTAAFLKTKRAHSKISLDPTKWHNLVIRIQGNLLKVWIDKNLVASLDSEGIGHSTKSNMNITTVDREVLYDNFSIRTH